MRKHPPSASNRRPLAFARPLAIVRHHHERWDGKAIRRPQAKRSAHARITAMPSGRADLGPALPRACPRWRSAARRSAGTQFDPNLIEVFVRVMKRPRRGQPRRVPQLMQAPWRKTMLRRLLLLVPFCLAALACGGDPMKGANAALAAGDLPKAEAALDALVADKPQLMSARITRFVLYRHEALLGPPKQAAYLQKGIESSTPSPPISSCLWTTRTWRAASRKARPKRRPSLPRPTRASTANSTAPSSEARS
jgi:hypothetical protein